MKEYLPIIIGTGVFAVLFGILWATGNLARLRTYVLETREELRKCTWPTMEELRGSTVVVVISIAIIGVFTIIIDYALVWIIRGMSKL